jgi:hypothetical protein
LRFPVAAKSLMTADECQVMAVLGTLEAIRSGTTSLLEISGNVAEYALTWQVPACGWCWRRTSTTRTSQRLGTAFSSFPTPNWKRDYKGQQN